MKQSLVCGVSSDKNGIGGRCTWIVDIPLRCIMKRRSSFHHDIILYSRAMVERVVIGTVGREE